MTAVLVHGNPETDAVWGPLLHELHQLGHDDLVRLSPPGFGAPLPAGFGATVGEYRTWLVAELEAFGEPVDLVGHDWGGGHVLGVAMTRPDLLRSWASDAVGLFDPDYAWHDLARIWQTPGRGEASVEELFGGTVDERAERMAARGVARPVADELAVGQNKDMGRAVLALYRSAAQPAMAKLGRDLGTAADRPGLSLLATEDRAIGSDELRRRAAARAGARTVVLDALGHWWMVEDPGRGAQALACFWGSLSG